MGTDYLAAKKDDVLVHASLLADFVSAVVKGAVYVGVAVGAAAAATAAAAAVIGSGGVAAPGIGYVAGALAVTAVGSGLGGLIDKVSDAAGDAADAVLDFFNIRGAPDGLIITGSPDVTIKGKPAARAAGKLPAASELDRLEAVDAKKQEEEETALSIACDIFLSLVPVDSVWEFIRHPVDSLKEMMSPVVAGANPHASPADLDKITCQKWHMMPASELFLAEGSRTVHINNQPACRNGDRSTCEAVISHTQTGGKVRIGGPAEAVRDIRSGKNPFITLAADAVVALVTRKVMNKFRKTGHKEPRPEDGCPIGNPVHAPSGAKIQLGESEQDFALDGYIPLIWQRLYDSRNRQTGMLGRGWRLPFEAAVYQVASPDTSTPPQNDLSENGPEQFIYVDDAGRELKLGGLLPGDSAFYTDEGFRVWRSKQDYFLLQTLQGDHSLFAPDPVHPGRWRLEKIMDRHCHALTLVYSRVGNVTHIHDDHHVLVVRLQHEQGRLCAVYQQSEDGSRERLLVSYTFTPDGQLAQVSDASQTVVRRFEYGEPHGLMVAQFYPAGRESHYRWQQFAAWTDDSGQPRPAHWRVAEHWIQTTAQPETPAVQQEHYLFEYDVPGQSLRVIQKGRGETRWRWDALGQVTEYTDELGAVWKNRWSPTRQLLSSTDPLGNTETWSYDDYGNVLVFTDALGRKTSTTWLPGFSFPLWRILPGQVEWRYDYNRAGDVICITGPDGDVTSAEWDEDGNNTVIHDAAGNTLHYRYNRRGQLTEHEDCSGHLTRRRYDEWGRLTHEINAAGNITRYGHTGNDRLHTLTRPDGNDLQLDYDPAGAVIRRQGYANEVTTFTRNARGQVLTRTDPAGFTLQFSYDPLGRLTQLCNEKGASWRFEYDARDDLIKETDPYGNETGWVRDAAGNVVTQTETPADKGPPLITRFEHDAAGQVTAVTMASRRREYRYDLLCTTVRDITAAGTTELRLEYDRRGRPVAEHNHGGCYRRQYDVLGNVTAVDYPDGRVLRHLYYGSGHLLETRLDSEDGSEVITEYARDRLHREVRRTQGRLSQYREYDICGRLTRQSSGFNAPQLMTPELDCHYQWDEGDNLRRLSCQDRHSGPGVQEEQFSYDVRGQITRHWQDGHSEAFRYDAAMNRLNSPHGLEADGAEGDYRYRRDGFGRLSLRENRRSGVKQRLHYNDEHRLINVEIQGDPACCRVTYSYDALGRRTEKAVWRHGQAAPQVTVFEWDGLRLCGEHGRHAADIHTLYLYEEGSYTPQARVDSYRNDTGRHQRVYHYHTLLNGRPRCMTGSDGSVVWRERMLLWGGSRQEDNSHAYYSAHPQQNLRFAGQYLDRETGLHYNTFRYYAPECGQFITRDPIGLAGGLNLYQYAPNPLSWIDPLGLKCSGPAGKLNRKLSALESAQDSAVNIRTLPDGRIRYYDAESLARTPGPTRGRSHVTEWNPKTGNVRSWEETYNHSGQVNRVHPKMKNGELLDLPHYPPTKADLDAGIATPSGRSIPFNLRGSL